MEILDLNIFFKKGGKIVIHYSSDFIDLKENLNFFGVWFFYDKYGKLKEVSTQTKLIFNGKEFDIEKYYQILKNRFIVWNREMGDCGYNFPNIEISKEYSNIRFFNKNRSIINICVDSLNNFDFTLNHELGHLFYFRSGMRSKMKEKFSQVKGKISKRYIFYLIFYLSLCLFYKDFLIYVGLAFSLLATAINFYASFATRYKLQNYAEEFFCDHYSQKYCDPNDLQYFFKKGMDYYINSSTHPSKYEREKFINNQKGITWVNPVENSYFLKNSFFVSLDMLLNPRWKNND